MSRDKEDSFPRIKVVTLAMHVKQAFADKPQLARIIGGGNDGASSFALMRF
jgi:hypothetical protein